MRAVIDIGSNSIRMMIEGRKDKQIITTQIAEGLAITGKLSDEAMIRTSKAIKTLYDNAKESGAEEVLAFATEAVRSASNGQYFIDMIKSLIGISTDLLSPDTEARAGFYGAYQGSGKAAVIDIGGASTEIVTGDENALDYIKSIPIGIVRLKDLLGQNPKELQNYILKRLSEYGKIPPVKRGYAIGGTASTLVAILLGGFDRDRVHNYRLKTDEVENVLNLLITSKDLSEIKGLPPMRATVIIGGIILLKSIMEMLNLKEIIVSEEDNMEGYLKLITKN